MFSTFNDALLYRIILFTGGVIEWEIDAGLDELL